MELKAEYKQSPFGPVPMDWSIAVIGDFDPFVTSGSRGWATYYSDFGHAFIRITNMTRGEISLSLDDLQYVALPNGINEGKRTALRHGDLLISITADIGIVCYVDEAVPEPSFINQHIAVVRFNSGKICPKFVAYFLAGAQSQRLFRAGTDVGAKAGMSLGGVRSVCFAYPDIEEQRAIAAALSDVDELLASLDALIAKKRDLKLAAMQELLTGQRRLPGFTGEWPEKALGTLGVWRGGATPSMANPLYWNSNDVPWVSSSDVQGTRLKVTEKSIANLAVKERRAPVIPAYSLLIVTRSGILRKRLPVAINQVPMAINQDVKAIAPNQDVSAEFLLQMLLLKGDEILSSCLKSGTTVESIQTAWMKKLLIPCPELSEQRAIAIVLSDMDSEIAALEARRDKTRALKQGMMQELLSGRVRLL